MRSDPFVSFFFFLLINISRGQDDGTIVSLPNGRIRGRISHNLDNKYYWVFQDIPYASPPIGKLRFKAPVPPENWEGILNTTSNKRICYQYNSNSNKESEDCLYLNVFTPSNPANNSASLPVYVFIHGGAFVGGGAPSSVQYLMNYDIIVVTVYYRLGPWGFLSTVDDVIEGNQGLKDTLMALKWVNSNIHLFGGDKEKVTLGGQSSGAAMVGYHVISNQTKGLIRAAIMESGSAICSWAYQRFARGIAFDLGRKIDPNLSPNATSQQLLELLQNASASDIDNNHVTFDADRIGRGDVFAPVIEVSEDAFIAEKMHILLEKGQFNQIPVMMGINSEERIYLGADLDSFKKRQAKFDADLSLIVNEDYNVPEEKQKEFGEYIRNIYTDALFQDNLGKAISFESDVRYTTSVIRQAHLQANYSEVYFYQFSYDGQIGNGNVVVEGAEKVGHSEELNYYWGSVDVTQYPEDDQITHFRMLELWTNFIKYMNPTPEKVDLLQNIIWPKVTPLNFTYLDINKDLVVKTNPKKYLEWKSGIDQFGNPPFDTY